MLKAYSLRRWIVFFFPFVDLKSIYAFDYAIVSGPDVWHFKFHSEKVTFNCAVLFFNCLWLP